MTSSKPFGTVPASARQQPTPYELHIDEQKLQDFKTLLRLSPIAKETYENLQDEGSHGRFGVSRKWMADAKAYWEQKYDWRETEAHINSFPNFTTTITDSTTNAKFSIHFTALFSSNPSAIPLAFFHGWPGSFLEFLPLLTLLRTTYTPSTLPYHILIPSLPGFGLSSAPPLDQDWRTADTARIMHHLLLSLGFGASGYLVQGGDIGSYIARIIAARYEECKGMHVNFMYTKDIEKRGEDGDEIADFEKKGLQRMEQFMSHGRAYSIEHATKPATIGLVLASSPLGLLAWVGEKFLAWSDPTTTPSLTTILSDVTLYWLTGSYPTSIYTYRDEKRDPEYVAKPVGYSYFPYELIPVPRAWAAKTANVVAFRRHERGGHFAALECTEELWGDVEEWVGVVWKGGLGIVGC